MFQVVELTGLTSNLSLAKIVDVLVLSQVLHEEPLASPCGALRGTDSEHAVGQCFRPLHEIGADAGTHTPCEQAQALGAKPRAAAGLASGAASLPTP